MNTETINRPLGPMDDLLLALAEMSAQTMLTVGDLRHQAKQQQFRTVRGSEGLFGLRLSSGDVDPLRAMRPGSQIVRSSSADRLVNSGDAAVLERTTTLLRKQAELIARLSEELVKECQQREAAQGATADLQGQLAELERTLCGAMSDSPSGDDGTVRTVRGTRELAEMEDQAKDWRRRSRKKPRSARRWLRKGVRRLLTSLAVA